MVAAVLGWLGTAGTFAAYLLVSRGRLQANSRRYALLNVVGGLLGGTASLLYQAWPSAASNFVWALVGIQMLTRSGSITSMWTLLPRVARHKRRSARCP